MKYFEEIRRSMDWLSQMPNTIFIGQAVEYTGTAMTDTLVFVPRINMYEMPVTEEMQMGISIGLSINGIVPISIFPRWNFLLLATNQLVNHLDKIALYSNREFKPKVIIRTCVGSERPINPQIQHTGDFTDAFRLMLKNIEIIRIEEPQDVFPAFEKAYLRDDGMSTIIVEYGDYYNEK